MPEVASCSKCSGDMERGFILDNAGGVGLPDRWMKGPLEPSIWGRGESIPQSKARCRNIPLRPMRVSRILRDNGI